MISHRRLKSLQITDQLGVYGQAIALHRLHRRAAPPREVRRLIPVAEPLVSVRHLEQGDGMGSSPHARTRNAEPIAGFVRALRLGRLVRPDGREGLEVVAGSAAPPSISSMRVPRRLPMPDSSRPPR